MNDIQNNFVLLLSEIDEICCKNKIPYLLCGRTAKDAYQMGGFLGDYMYASVLMPGEYFKKFQSLVKKNMGNTRAVESILTNPDYPDGLSMRYVNEQTTFLRGDSAHKCRHKGIYITIQRCRSIADKNGKLVKAADKLIEYIMRDSVADLSRKKRILNKAVKMLGGAIGKRNFIKLMLKIRNLLTKNSTRYEFFTTKKNGIIIPASMFSNVQRVNFEGKSFLVPYEIENYLRLVYGSRWAKKMVPEAVYSPHLLVASSTISYKQVMKDSGMNDLRIDIDNVIKKRSSISSRTQELRKKIEKNWDVLFLTQQRHNLYRLYKPVENIIKERYEQRDYEWLLNAMNVYLEQITIYAKKGWPVAVTPTLDNIAEGLLYYSGKAQIAGKYAELRKKKKLKPVEIVITEKMKLEAEQHLSDS